MDTITSSNSTPLKSSDSSSENGLIFSMDMTSKEASDKSSKTNGKMIFGTHLINLSSFSSHLNETFPKFTPPNDQNTPDDEIPMAITAREILLSEDYTRVTCYDPNPRNTHIFCDFSLECRPDQLIMNSGKKREDVMSLFNQVDICSCPSVELLNNCEACNEKFKQGEVVYKFRGKSSFCSSECLAVGILAAEISKTADKSPSFSSDDEFIFHLDLD